ncbi:MAG: hypothetical protein RLZZ15_3996 [Verrucomicrobiota bacterium]|jgi:uncharacterized membrane protein YkvA (DUF1232 family)
MNTKNYSAEYSEKSLWDKLATYALRAGKEVIQKVLVLYECLNDGATPVWAKGVILGALGYFISPIDLIPDVIPIVGFTDDATALIAAFSAVSLHVKDEHIAAAKTTLGRWFEKSVSPTQ